MDAKVFERLKQEHEQREQEWEESTRRTIYHKDNLPSDNAKLQIYRDANGAVYLEYTTLTVTVNFPLPHDLAEHLDTGWVEANKF